MIILYITIHYITIPYIKLLILIHYITFYYCFKAKSFEVRTPIISLYLVFEIIMRRFKAKNFELRWNDEASKMNIEGKGSLDGFAKGASFAIVAAATDWAGKPLLAARACQVQIKELDAKAEGTGVGIDAFNMFSKAIMEKHKDTVGNEICKQIQKAIDWQLNKTLMSAP